ncbi:MAG: GNAT family N-acetyltransferase [Desulfoferrobacter sp.]
MKEVQICGYYPGVIGKITELHAVYYNEYWGFDVSFETQVGRELSEFMNSFQPARDGLWVATVAGKFAGSIVIDGRQAQTDGARLRWFIVHPNFQNAGIGKALISRAIEFCKNVGYARAYLWTFQGLDAARKLYEGCGFELREEHQVIQWGQSIKEQMFTLDLLPE